MLIDDFVSLSEEEIDHDAKERTEDDLESDDGKGHRPLALEVPKHDRESFVGTGDEDGNKSAQSDVVFGEKVTCDDGDSALRDHANQRAK